MDNPIQLRTPLTDECVRNLRAGQEVLITGEVFTARDEVHKYLTKTSSLPPGMNLQGGIIYHCGPVVVRDRTGKWQVIAAGPTTSAREEPYESEIIQRFGVKGIIGKGGMGRKTLDAMGTYGCVYFHTIGGAAQVLAECVSAVENVWFLDKFGVPEAMWKLSIVKFPAIVTMDTHGDSLHERIRAASMAQLSKLIGQTE